MTSELEQRPTLTMASTGGSGLKILLTGVFPKPED